MNRLMNNIVSGFGRAIGFMLAKVLFKSPIGLILLVAGLGYMYVSGQISL